MARKGVRLNRRGVERLLKSQGYAAAVNNIVRDVAAEAGPDAVFDEYTTDRAAGSISVPAEQQARDGLLTRAAAAVGLEVRLK